MLDLGVNGQHSFLLGSLQNDLLLVVSGIATSLPLLWFGIGVQKIPLYLTGFLQYIAPSISLIIGVYIYGKPFTKDHVFTFICIWLAIAIFTIANIFQGIKKRRVSTITTNANNF